jgi:hypothetical protein
MIVLLFILCFPDRIPWIASFQKGETNV